MCESPYDDARLYDLLAPAPGRDLIFWMDRIRRHGDPVLELACGTGRLTVPLAVTGARLTGLDLSPALLGVARRRSSAVEWVAGDMRDYDLGRRFRLVFVAFNALLHLHRGEDLEAFFACALRHLREDGALILDVFNPRPDILARDPSRRYPVASVWDSEAEARLTVEETTRYDRASQTTRALWHLSYPGRPDARRIDLNLRVLFPLELDALVESNGFAVEERLGDYDGRPFASDSPLQILVCRPRQAAGAAGPSSPPVRSG